MLNDSTDITVVLNYIDAPEAQDPGAITKRTD